MARKGSIDILPSELRDAVNRKLLDDGWTLDQVVELIDLAGHDVSRSAVHRHKVKIEDVSEKLRRGRMVAETLAREIGPNSVGSKQGQILVELLQGITFNFLANAGEDGDDELEAKDIRQLAAAIKDTASARSIDQARELKIREEVAKANAKKLDAAVADAGKAGEKGLSAERIEQLRRDFLGVRPQ